MASKIGIVWKLALTLSPPLIFASAARGFFQLRDGDIAF